MLKLTNITKRYNTAGFIQTALSEVSICFRESEFVSILGPSGSGKTTLLNIIGGLDQYTSGDLIINGISTKKYSDRDWDTYRNHSVGFVFQSYNLIPHQTVLANVEMALTLSGVSKAERRQRAIDVLNTVGLGDHIRKKPNQMSGGQMQRVAIARALINNPDILLADEPTGALDTETSLQIMDILKTVAKDRLVIMVTHNPELAEKYSDRIVRLLDGKITDDTRPYIPENSDTAETAREKAKGKKKTSMSFFTALSLSFNNLLTKKARTILTSFAGSIGIIGIALILSVSTGFQEYINRMQEDTISSYPITILAESTDLSSLISSFAKTADQSETSGHDNDAVYESHILYDLINTMNNAEITKNNLTKFKEFVDTDKDLRDQMSAVKYVYDIDFNVYVKDSDGKIANSDIMGLFRFGSKTSQQSGQTGSASSLSLMSSSYDIWEEMLSGTDGELISDTLKDQYELVHGHWPESYDEVVLVLNKNNEISDLVLYSLGLKTKAEMTEIMMAASTGKTIDTSNTKSWSYEEIENITFKLVLNPYLFMKNADGTYTNLSETESGIEYLYKSGTGINLKISGIIKPSENAVTSMMKGSIGYTAALSDEAIRMISESEILNAQLTNPDKDVFTGNDFKPLAETELTDEEKATAAREKIAALNDSQKAALYKAVRSVPTDEDIQQTVSAMMAQWGNNRTVAETMIASAIAKQMGITDETQIEAYVKTMTDEEITAAMQEIFSALAVQSYAEEIQKQFEGKTDSELAALLDGLDLSDEICVKIYDNLLPNEYSESTFEDNLEILGYVSESSPDAIYIYTTTFEAKDKIEELIEKYNKNSSDDDKITYTDYVKLIMSSITVIIDAITIVLTGFVGISLVVSSIMIGIITYISVLERTKEIGILRAVGASKKDIFRVFTAESVIIGFTAGFFGIVISLILLIPINIILYALTGIAILKAILPVAGAVVLVIISMFLTFIAGLFPSGIAARKNPVEALRTE